ncbi:MAG: CPBP family intramembrane metalloprotease, partial [Alphaproteobacteria bacterium]
LYGWLRSRVRSGFGAAVLSGIGFAVLHGLPVLIPALSVIGLALAIVYERSGSLWPAIITHGVFNAFMVAALYTALAAGVGPP